ncbi:FKBP-type peptidyl-prolyl cis-trans isomerase [Yersinia intermedia]|jgi:FKBP-type peptidyl-prolyl cis-trans isomerase FkpA|uniref:FKBP-type peptidyl-prolyl cis-trans isomerase N-terminal domain-containing protein n=1 Tax=Yersinia intermedia TaxID=631 RepID=UPI00223EB4B9|nr:FKBP-type peptidyl-prolyl cis-trans isomerase N-terminal domain-containing protein [Yersinia intermedia]UZM72350.1 FKBP-type peptidyl-prolyl cis-trans isomerase [Yersinia intermedia]
MKIFSPHIACWYLISTGVTIFSAHAEVHPQNGNIPALLQFAEQYQGQNTPASPPETEPQQGTKIAKPSIKKTTSPLMSKPTETYSRNKNWQMKDAQLQKQRAIIDALKQQLTSLQEQVNRPNVTEKPSAPLNLSDISQLAQNLRQALGITPSEHQMEKQLKQAQQLSVQTQKTEEMLRSELAASKLQSSNLRQRLKLNETESARLADESNNTLNNKVKNLSESYSALEQTLLEQQKINQKLTHDLARLTEQQHKVEENSASQRQQATALAVKNQEISGQLSSKEQQLGQLQQDFAALQAQIPQKVSAKNLKMPKIQQDYAVGISLGEEILLMQAERAQWGVKTDKQIILSGIIDTFAGEQRLPDDILATALANAEKEVSKARDNTRISQTKTDSSYLEKFKQRKGVKQASSGFWYQINYAGDNTIPEAAIVDVVVKEMLTDGTVVQDMEASGATLSQPVADFPPLFKEAIAQLRNHGSMTLVVPAKLAYGEKGYPPKIPPNATMVYQLRIAEMYPAEHKKTLQINNSGSQKK